MNKRAFIFAALAVLTVNAFAQTAFTNLTESLYLLCKWRSIVEVADFEYNGENAIWGTNIDPGKSASQSLRYDAGVEYLMLASADTRGTDIHLKVYRGQGTDGTVVARDLSPDTMPIARFTPSESGWHCFELINASRSPAFVSMIILKKKKNANFSLSALDEATTRFMSLSKYLNSLYPKSGIPANNWTIFGGNIREGSAAVLSNVQTSKVSMGGKYVMAGVGENSVVDCDAEVIEQYATNNPEGRKITQANNSRFPYDYMIFSPNPSKYLHLKVINKSSRNPSAFLFGFLVSAQ